MRVGFPAAASRPLRVLLRGGATVCLALLAAACATLPAPEAENQDALAELFADNYRWIEGAHIEETDAAELALGGLRSLAAADEQLHDEYYVVWREGASLPEPSDHDAWGALTSEAVIGLVAQSQHLQAMEPQEVYELFATGLVPQLSEPTEFFPGDSVFDIFFSEHTRKFDMGYDLVADGVRVARLDPKGELEEQGLRLGDVIVDIEGTPTAGLPKRRIFELLGSGLEFGSTTVTILRAGSADPITLELWDTTGAKHNVQVRENDGIAEYSFVYVNDVSTRFMQRSVSRREDLRFRGINADKDFYAKSILLDLRNTPSHPDLPVFTEQDAAVGLAGAFLSGDPAGSARSRHPGFQEEWKADLYPSSLRYPLVVVVDSVTSGGAEIAAAVLQDSGRALVVGTSSAGNGKLHGVVGLATGGILVMPSAHSYSPAGYPIEGRGVTPHVCTSLPGASLDGLLAELRQGRGLIPQEQRERVMEPGDAAAVAEQRALCPAAADTRDLAYDLAVAILKEPGLYEKLMGKAPGS